MRKAMVTVVLTVALLTSPAAAGATKLTSAEEALLRIVNATRASYGMAELRADAALTSAARFHSRQLLALGRLEHGDFGDRLRRFGARGPVLAENLAWGTGAYTRAGAIVRAWLDSPPHRANLLRPGFRRIGLGAAYGEFAGRAGTIVVTADFAGS
jgi:uncharacterized protein YkwD